jgi:hypothetical protein
MSSVYAGNGKRWSSTSGRADTATCWMIARSREF